VPTIVEAAGAALVGAATDAAALERGIEAAAAAFGDLDAVEDLNGSADYKRHLGAVLLASTTRAAVQEAIAHA
jgi:CO/xanthine dehydrogenase FAD-binding subunit